MCAKKTGSLEGLAVVGIDMGKDTFHLVGFDRAGQLVMRKQIKRLALNATFEQLPRCIVGMEACLSAHFVSRTLRGMGFAPRIIPAIYVKPFNKGQKNDYNDAEAIAEASLRPNLRTVSEKDQDQLDLQALHRVRARLVSRRTATINQIRAFLIEQGITVRAGLRALKNSFETILEQRRDEISPRMRGILIGLYGDWLWLDRRIEDVSEEIAEISRTEENCANIMTIPGIGPMISTAMVAAVGKGEAFDRGRDFAAWVGLVPRQFSTGGRTILGRITKRGSGYLRMLFVQAAKVIMMRPHRWSAFSFGPWLTAAVARMPRNKAAVALANKLARTAWSLLRHGTRFDASRDIALEVIRRLPRLSRSSRERGQHGTETIRPQSLTALKVIIDLAANETKGACVTPSRPRPACRSKGRIHMSDFRSRAKFSIANSSRHIHMGRARRQKPA